MCVVIVLERFHVSSKDQRTAYLVIVVVLDLPFPVQSHPIVDPLLPVHPTLSLGLANVFLVPVEPSCPVSLVLHGPYSLERFLSGLFTPTYIFPPCA